MAKKILVLAAGTDNGGGSGAANLIEQSRLYPALNYTVTCVVSNHENGGVRQHAERLGVPFYHFSSTTWSGEEYRQVLEEHGDGAYHVACSGWLKPVRGLFPGQSFNIHPGDLTVLHEGKPRYGGKGMYGIAVHRRVIDDGRPETAVCMHFMPDFDEQGYDQGPIFFRKTVPVKLFQNAELLAARVNAVEHQWQPYITSLVVNHLIYPDGPSIKVPLRYPFLPGA